MSLPSRAWLPVLLGAAFAGHALGAGMSAQSAGAEGAGEPDADAGRALPRVLRIDPAATRVEFSLRLMLIKRLDGRFPLVEGEVRLQRSGDGARADEGEAGAAHDPDTPSDATAAAAAAAATEADAVADMAADTATIDVRIDAREVMMARASWSEWARSPEFFDALRHPWIQFQSDDVPLSLFRDGGALQGMLTLRGQARPVTLTVLPAPCGQPGTGCPVYAEGELERSDFGMNARRFVLGDKVRLQFEIRVQPEGADDPDGDEAGT